MNSLHTDDRGISEIVGSLILIGIFVAAIGVMGVYYLSQPAPQKIPAIHMIFSNESNVVSVYHGGGDPIPVSQLSLIVDGVSTSFTGAGNDNTWSLGETLVATAPGVPGRVDVVYSGGGSSGVLLATMIFGQIENPLPIGTFFTISAVAGSHGTISPSGSVVVASGSDRAFSLVPDIGYRIADVVVDGSSVGAPSSFTFTRVTASHTIAASFILAPLSPVVDFTGAPLSGAPPLTVSFTDASTNSPISWTWNFGDGDSTNSSLQNPVHGYANPGTYTVTLTATNAGGSNAATKVGYITVTSLSPTITGITPNSGTRGTIVSITTLAGTGFQSGATVKLNRSGQPDIAATGISVVSATNITCSFNLIGVTSGAWNVVVTNPDGRSDVLPNGFTVISPAPSVSSSSPNIGATGTSVTITNLSGTGFQPGATVNYRNGATTIPLTGVTVVSATRISGTLVIPPGSPAGLYSVTVTNTDGQSGTANGIFTVSSPTHSITESWSPSGLGDLYSPTLSTLLINGATVTVADGASRTFYFVPKSNKQVISYTIDGTVFSPGTGNGVTVTYTFPNVTIDHTVSVNFG